MNIGGLGNSPSFAPMTVQQPPKSQPAQQPESRLEEAKEPQSERNREEGKGTIIDTQA